MWVFFKPENVWMAEMGLYLYFTPEIIITRYSTFTLASQVRNKLGR
jgi:hypothetical protein